MTIDRCAAACLLELAGFGAEDIGSMAEEYLIQLITPIFGGGIKPGENDPEMLIRPSSIRGHLRFWWRATKGAKFESASQLFDREGEVWGTPDNPSPVKMCMPDLPKISEITDESLIWDESRSL